MLEMTAKELYEQYEKQQKKYAKDFKIALIKSRLSAPNPIRYELWYALHYYLEKLEKYGG